MGESSVVSTALIVLWISNLGTYNEFREEIQPYIAKVV